MRMASLTGITFCSKTQLQRNMFLGLEPPLCPILNSAFLVVPGTISSGRLELSVHIEAERIVSWE